MKFFRWWVISCVIIFSFTSVVGAAGAEYYVAPDGNDSNLGTIDSPWNLNHALTAADVVQPGDTIYLRGGYYNPDAPVAYETTVAGTKADRIMIRNYPGEIPTINGGIRATTPYLTFYGLHITNTSPRDTSPRSPGLNLLATGTQAINNVIYNSGHPGIGFWRGGEGDPEQVSELYGNIIFGTGMLDDGWIRGSAVYMQNAGDKERLLENNMLFWSYNFGLKAYSEGGPANNFTYKHNIAFSNSGANYYGSAGWHDAGVPMQNFQVIENVSYRRPQESASHIQVGYRNEFEESAVIEGNYLAGGAAGIDLRFPVERLTIADNFMTSHRMMISVPEGFGSFTPDIYNNEFFSLSGDPSVFRDETGSPVDFTTWQDYGYDMHSELMLQPPPSNKVFIFPNKYESDRAHIAVVNWEQREFVTVDVSDVLDPGDEYQLIDVQNFFNTPLLQGIYTGEILQVTMTMSSVSGITGVRDHYANYDRHTAPDFAAFLLVANDQRITNLTDAITPLDNVINATTPPIPYMEIPFDEGQGGQVHELNARISAANFEGAKWITDSAQCIMNGCVQITDENATNKLTFANPNGIPFIDNEFTLSLWFKLTDLETLQYIFSLRDTVACLVEERQLVCGDMSYMLSESYHSTWNHLVVSSNGYRTRIFLNGRNIGIQINSHGALYEDSIVIGRGYHWTGHSFMSDGYVDEFKLYQTEMNETQVINLYLQEQPKSQQETTRTRSSGR